jgi:hypothetical protein
MVKSEILTYDIVLPIASFLSAPSTPWARIGRSKGATGLPATLWMVTGVPAHDALTRSVPSIK